MHGYVLAGGESRRMGSDKRVARVGGETMLSRVIAVLSEAEGISSVAVVAKSPLVQIAPARFVSDAHHQQAALCGVEAALADASPDLQALIVACDYPLIRPATIERLIARSREVRDRITLLKTEESLHPLVAVWPTSALSIVRRRLEDGDLRISDAIAAIGFLAIGVEELSGRAEELENVNAPGDLNRVRRIDGEEIQSSR